MKLPTLILVLFSLCVTITKCLSPRSILSCAVGIRSNTYLTAKSVLKFQNLIKEDTIKRADEQILFYLHSKENLKGQKIDINDTKSLKKGFFNPNRPTKIITHGYWNSRESIACTQPLNAFLSNGDYNVIVVDWWKKQKLLFDIPKWYTTVVTYIDEVANKITEMLNFLEDQGNNPDTTTLVGHSLGAHILGIASYNAKRQVNYIVGLDPALPKFQSRHPSKRLSIEDATTVEVIHTNGGDCGMSFQIGHYDFYPNGGNNQPGCIFNVCSHSRAIEFYAESINSQNGFFGRKCINFNEVKEGNCTGNLAKMGGGMKKRNISEGMYYLETNKASPYAQGV